LPGSLEKLAAHFAANPPSSGWELIVVDDGSPDGTSRAAMETSRKLSLPLRLIAHETNRGKGAAVRTGTLAAAGDRILVTDADLSTPIGELAKLQAAIDAGASVAIGSRALDPGLVRQRQPLFRVAMGKFFNVCVRVFCVEGISDTQCGFKLFTWSASRDVFSRAQVDRFAWDVEALLLARRLGHRIDEVPVLWFNADESSVSLAKGAQAYLELLRIRRAVDRALRP
jgi:dolichyl-phosphate beta-glucosyltransferase